MRPGRTRSWTGRHRRSGRRCPDRRRELTLTYSEPVEPLFSTVEVKNAGGALVNDGKPTPEGDGRVLVVRLKPLQPGVYSVAWHVTSVDTHKTDGHFTFTVKP